MSGHNKWSTIKHKKAAVDAKRGKIFSRYSKEITLAVRSGGKDADMNPRLRTALNAARGVNMPNDNIERAIKKGAGELQGAALEELNFEGYAPGGVGIVINCLSDNRNRTAAEIRNIFTKNNGSMAATGAVSWQFHRKARFVVEGEGLTEDKLLELLLDAGADAETVTCEDGVGEIVAPPDEFNNVAKALEAAKIAVTESSITLIPENMCEVTEESIAKQAVRMIDALEDNDDAQAVYHNLSMSNELAEKISG